MWGMYLGLDMAWRENTTHIIVESDSKILVDMITENCNFSGTTPTLVGRIRQLLSLSWIVKITHTWREGNRSADWLANFSISMDFLDFHILETPPSELQSLLVDDIIGACMPRNVRLIS
ncbi:putative ribonuclease H-like domain-containing protein [Medicago truncatula]|uniref:Putative ribonuclease H-like domain-containing protein n=1 Tax=Medicago truncatula TaxID=3880 RepID=A0A396IDE3_MEDTR|nr:putative ribonuclease H-like domain-containing protein [Medicago truncatula]